MTLLPERTNDRGQGRSHSALPVVAGIIEDRAGRILLAQRPPGGNEAGKWEFPGGKIHPGETAQAALARELDEELGIAIGNSTHFASVHWRGPPRALNLHGFHVDAPPQAAHAHAHSALAWARREELVGYDVPAPDRPLVARLALPARYLITPDRDSGLPGFLVELARALTMHVPGAVLLRTPSLPLVDRSYWAEVVLACVRAQAPGTLAFLHADWSLAARLGYDGAHLPGAGLAALSVRPLPSSFWLIASCHDRAQLELAESLRMDAAVLGPVKPTLSHPHARALGWRRFARLASSTWLPLYALGGVTASDQQIASASGAHGISGISAFWPD